MVHRESGYYPILQTRKLRFRLPKFIEHTSEHWPEPRPPPPSQWSLVSSCRLWGKMTKLYGSNQSILVGVYIFIYSCRRIWNFTHKKNNLQTSLLHGLFLWTSALVLFGLIMKSNAGWRYVIFKCICFTVKIWHATTNGCGFRRKCSCCIGHKVVSFFMIGED